MNLREGVDFLPLSARASKQFNYLRLDTRVQY